MKQCKEWLLGHRNRSHKAENCITKVLRENKSHPGAVYAATLHFINEGEIYFRLSNSEKNLPSVSLAKEFCLIYF